MIHIDVEGKTPTEEWLQRASAVTEQLNRATTKEERQMIIDRNRAFWGEVKE